MGGPSGAERYRAARGATSRVASSGSRHSKASSFEAEPSNTRPVGTSPSAYTPPKPPPHSASPSSAGVMVRSGSGSFRYQPRGPRDSVNFGSPGSSGHRPSGPPITIPERAELPKTRALSRTAHPGPSNAVPLVAFATTPKQLPAESPSPGHRSKWPSQSEQTLRSASSSPNPNVPAHRTLMEGYIDKKEGLKDAIKMLNEMAAGIYRGPDVARLCDDNNVAGLERETPQLPRRPYDQDRLSLVSQIDKLKKEYGVKQATEPEDSLTSWFGNGFPMDLQKFNPFTKQEPRGPGRGQSQTWQREHLKSSDPLQREMDDLFEEPTTRRRLRRSNGPEQDPSQPPSVGSVFQLSNIQVPQPSQPRSRAGLSRPQSESQASGSQPPRSRPIQSQSYQPQLYQPQSFRSQSFQSQVQQWKQSRASASQNGSQPSGSQPSRPQSFRSQPPSGSQQPQSLPSGSQRSQSQRPPPQQSQPQQPHTQQYQAQPQQPQQRPQQRTNSWPRNQELQSFAAHSLSYVAEAPREESAPSVSHPVETATYELDELPDGSTKSKSKSGQGEASQAEAGQDEAGQDEAGQEAGEDAEADEEKPFCAIRNRCVIGPFPGWNSRWFTRQGDDPA